MSGAQVLVCACVLLNTVSSMPNVRDEWEAWKQKFGKTYPALEEKQHQKIWESNFEYVLEHNSKGNTGFEVELNHLADQKFERTPIDHLHAFKDKMEQKNLKFAPQSWDWRTKGAIGPVRDQGQLGDVQSIVATECVQSYAEIQTGRLLDVSTMEVHDCCVKSRLVNRNIFQCIHDIGGLCSAASYPSSAGTCRNNTCTAIAQINGGNAVPSGDEAALMEAVSKMPVMTAVDASHVSFQLYSSGIYSEPKCSNITLDHMLQIVGYGSMNGVDYWICRNSWGASWGENGYIRIARNKNNMCGIATGAEYPV